MTREFINSPAISVSKATAPRMITAAVHGRPIYCLIWTNSRAAINQFNVAP